LAKQDLDEALRLNDRLALAYFNRGNLRNRLGEFDAAMTDFEMSYRCGHNDMGCIKLGTGIAQLECGRFGDAVQSLTQAISYLQESRLPEAYLVRAKAYRSLENTDNALADLRWIITRDCDYSSPESREAYRICRQLAGTNPELAGSCECGASEIASNETE
jgi:tetratricopeptide (TPR) repeat protein